MEPISSLLGILFTTSHSSIQGFGREGEGQREGGRRREGGERKKEREGGKGEEREKGRGREGGKRKDKSHPQTVHYGLLCLPTTVVPVLPNSGRDHPHDDG